MIKLFKRLKKRYNMIGLKSLFIIIFTIIYNDLKKPFVTIFYFLDKRNKIVYYYCSRGGCKSNIGDKFNKTIIKKYSSIIVYDYNDLIIKPKEEVYLGIGSILDNIKINNVVIWGSGFMKKDSQINSKFIKANLVRGKLTARKLGLDVLNYNKFGDPGLLVSKIYKERVLNKNLIGIIPHLNDSNNRLIKEVAKKKECIVINPKEKYEVFMYKLNSCSIILSSSLHGLIFSDSFKKKNFWVKFSNNVPGNDFKFYDYYSGVNINKPKPILIRDITSFEMLLKKLDKLPFEYRKIDYEAILDSCPFFQIS